MVKRKIEESQPVSLDELLELADDNDAVAVAEGEPDFDLTADVGELEPAEPAPRAADILVPTERYDYRDIQRLLGVDPQLMAEHFGHPRHAHTPPTIAGKTLIDWLDGDGVPIAVTDEGRTHAAQVAEAQARRDEAAAKRAADPLVALLDGAERMIAQEKQAESTAMTGAWRFYAGVISRLATGNVQEKDGHSLAVLMGELNLDRARIDADISMVRQVAELRSEHALLNQRQEAHREATAAYAEVVKRHKVELEQARRAKGNAETMVNQSRGALDSLRGIAGARQELFSDLGQFNPRGPVLLGEEANV